MNRIRFLYLPFLCACGLFSNDSDTLPGRADLSSLQIIVGDVTHESAFVWGRANGHGMLCVRVNGETRSRLLQPEHDFGATLRVTGLRSSYEYGIQAWLGDCDVPPRSTVRYFTTAPNPDQAAPVRFAFGGDVGGQNVCRHIRQGFPLFESLAGRPLNFFIGLGDQIYGDGVCERDGLYGQRQVVGRFAPVGSLHSQDPREDLWAHWRYTREDRFLRRVLERFPYVAVWDDHEVTNDFDRDEPLLPFGVQAFRDHNPVPDPLFRSIRWGRHAQLIVLDTRSYRAPNDQTDDGENPKSMLGPEQKEWLWAQLRSDSTWKFIVSSVPISIPTGESYAYDGRDGWSDEDSDTGYERELVEIFQEARRVDARLVFLSSDVHFASVFRYRPFDDAFLVYEMVAGPMNAGVAAPRAPDETFHPERLFQLGATPGEEPASWDEARLLFNYGEIELDIYGKMKLTIRTEEGEKYALALIP